MIIIKNSESMLVAISSNCEIIELGIKANLHTSAFQELVYSWAGSVWRNGHKMEDVSGEGLLNIAKFLRVLVLIYADRIVIKSMEENAVIPNPGYDFSKIKTVHLSVGLSILVISFTHITEVWIIGKHVHTGRGMIYNMPMTARIITIRGATNGLTINTIDVRYNTVQYVNYIISNDGHVRINTRSQLRYGTRIKDATSTHAISEHGDLMRHHEYIMRIQDHKFTTNGDLIVEKYNRHQDATEYYLITKFDTILLNFLPFDFA